jgi:hypothetical protein
MGLIEWESNTETGYDWFERMIREIFYRRKISRKPYVIYLVDVFGGREKHRRLIEVAHRIEFGPFARRMIEFVNLLASRSRHFSFCRSPLLISGLSFGSLKKKVEIY